MPTDAELRALEGRARRVRETTVEYGSQYVRVPRGFLLDLLDAVESLLRPQEPERAARERLGEGTARELAVLVLQNIAATNDPRERMIQLARAIVGEMASMPEREQRLGRAKGKP